MFAFGKEAGPTSPPLVRPYFGEFPRLSFPATESPLLAHPVASQSPWLPRPADKAWFDRSVNPRPSFGHLRGPKLSEGVRSLPLAREGSGDTVRSFTRPDFYPPSQDVPLQLPGNYTSKLAYQQKLISHSQHIDLQGSYMAEAVDRHNLKKLSSPPVAVSPEISQKNNFPRLPMCPPKWRSSPSADLEEPASTRASASPPVVKRTRSPSLPFADEVLDGNSYSTHDYSDRELQAKAKRLARFKDELSDDLAEKMISENRAEPPAGDHEGGSSLETSPVIIGSCPDMCPESERAERERKGDLHHYERLDGERNQTSRLLAVKKYNRTAEREANLIRPMPILQKTFDYLLDLLNQPYDDAFLGLYNFLWDRMRAIRMDLRMQHIFSMEAATMLEKMIRLHVAAMHELCESAKGEGLSEGFDAHLNIEQMNKTSVELFQIYDDQRKKGISFSTEREFRGYYALLKLDKHPGYKVEPAELSLDLAKMNPEIRQSPEVLFARSVARACRTGNFVAFFRHARKAKYLQACLMHAHFAKLHAAALESLHAGLQSNQGLPVSLLAKWLAMEEEDPESLLELHGFTRKEFEELYLVKDGPFIHSEIDYATRCSKLVQLKRSRTVLEDVSPLCQRFDQQASENSFPPLPNESPLSPIVSKQVLPLIENSISHDAHQQTLAVTETPVSAKMMELSSSNQALPMNAASWPTLDESTHGSQETEKDTIMKSNEDEVGCAKLKLIFRLWRRHALQQREVHEQRQIAASAALRSLAIGPPIRQKKDKPRMASKFDIDHVMRERCRKQEESCSMLNVSDATADILGTRNPAAKCLCWKIVLSSQASSSAAGRWLISKLIPVNVNGSCDRSVVISSARVSMWQKWVSRGSESSCCLSVIKDVDLDHPEEAISGASAIMFALSENVPWNLQKFRLSSLITSLTPGSSLPLLIISGSSNSRVSDSAFFITAELGLHTIDRSRVRSFSVVFLVEDGQTDGFFSDGQLRLGLKWLASESPLQPNLVRVTTRELVLDRLTSSSMASEKTSDGEIGPDMCIATFNDCLDWCLEEIRSAAKENPCAWPCPEIELLADLHGAQSALDLPDPGWSNLDRLGPLLAAVAGCKLPDFFDLADAPRSDGSSARTCMEIQSRKSELEKSLARYLTESSKMMDLQLAEKEARLMLQRNCRLEVRGSDYHIIPCWPLIFRRIFSWRLTSLSSKKSLASYVLRSRVAHVDPTSRVLDEPPMCFNQPSLDEMIEFETSLTRRESPPAPSSRLDGGDENARPVTNDVSRAPDSSFVFDCNVDPLAVNSETVMIEKIDREFDKLSALLERCNLVQNSIDEKLSIYF